MISTRKVPFKDLEIDSAGKTRASFNRLNGTVASRAGGSAEDRQVVTSPTKGSIPKTHNAGFREDVYSPIHSPAELCWWRFMWSPCLSELLLWHDHSEDLCSHPQHQNTQHSFHPSHQNSHHYPWCHRTLQKALTPLRHISWHL